MSRPPYSLGHDMPSHPFAASFFMKARRSGVSASCEKFSRWWSITTGSWFSTSHCSTSSANFCSSGEKSKSTGVLLGGTRGAGRPSRASPRRSEILYDTKRFGKPEVLRVKILSPRQEVTGSRRAAAKRRRKHRGSPGNRSGGRRSRSQRPATRARSARRHVAGDGGCDGERARIPHEADG